MHSNIKWNNISYFYPNVHVQHWKQPRHCQPIEETPGKLIWRCIEYHVVVILIWYIERSLRKTVNMVYICLDELISCGHHNAPTCSECPQGNGEAGCNGVCKWENAECISKGILFVVERVLFNAL